jgi:outer membrane receptor protein involved in Fe transport
MYASAIGKRFSYKAGLRGEFSTVTLSSTHESLEARNNTFFLAPSLLGTYRLAGNDEVAFAFSRRTGRPSYPQLNPYMSMVDATTYEQGNMNLAPEKSSKVDLSYSHAGKSFKLFADVYLNHTAGYISQITKFKDDLLVTTYINAESDLKSGLDLSLTVSPLKWMNATLSTNTFHVSTKGTFDGADIDNRGWSNNSNILFDFAPGKTTDIQLQYFLTTPQYYPQLTTSLTHYMNVGVKQRLLKGAMNISLLLTDVFDTYRWKVHSYNNVFDLTNLSTRKSRMLWLGIAYNINSFKQKKAQSKTEDDRSLIKLGL